MSKLPNIEQILERQARSWELRRRLAGEGGEAAREALAHLTEGPWLTISRQLGSGGDDLARRLGERLGWQVYDRQILVEIARETHSRERVLAQLDERAIAPFQEFIARLLVRDDPSQLGYLKELAHVVWGLARQGQAIIVGRAANWFLDDRFGLRVRVVAPVEDRVERMVAELGCGVAEARKLVQAHDVQRSAFIEQYFGQDVNDPQGYDLVLNTGALEIQAAVEVVLTALRRKLSTLDEATQ